ncbi:MAG: hypothetical protein ACD_62C00557G0004 [uncultured bacterium]|nr:MAG: hypothetical protein ACD_62C00557G0004 [uncultured bacterium]
MPEVKSLVIILIDGHPQFVFGQFDHLGQKLPRKTNGTGLEIIAKTEIAEHFKKSVVTGCAPHIFEIVVFAGDAHALL